MNMTEHKTDTNITKINKYKKAKTEQMEHKTENRTALLQGGQKQISTFAD